MKDFDISIDMNRVKAEEFYALAKKLRRNKQYAEALTAINSALQNFGDDENYLDERDTIQSRLSLIEERAARIAAEEKAREAIRRDGGSPTGTTLPASSIRRDGGSPSAAGPAAEVEKIAHLQAGDRKVLTYDGIDYAFRWCPPGEFTMGSPEDEQYRDDDENQHKVKLTKGFWLMETEVTQAMWESVMGTTVSEQRDKEGPYRELRGRGANYPMYYVNWTECKEFCRKLSQKLGQQIQLPTEAQWEYACRAGTTGAYAGELDEMGWYDDNSDSTTHEVGLKKPNAWGLYDMHGNVYEWCLDWYGEEYYSESPTSDPTGPNSGSLRVFRGGGWDNDARSCRSANRDRHNPVSRYFNRGLRVLVVPVQ